jgi:hypothetical protein
LREGDDDGTPAQILPVGSVTASLDFVVNLKAWCAAIRLPEIR